ncbi:MAG: TIGR03943 family protein [Herbiconiux sp.]|nr:TIGR03943 family protein [Herbiconiux sp.]
MSDRLIARWRGIALSLIGIVATVWLAASGQLGLYIHPRYFEFTVIMAVLAGVVVLAAFALVPGAPDADGHDHGDGPGPADGPEHADGPSSSHSHASAAHPPRRRRLDALWAAAAVVIIAGTAVALLVLPPQTLTTATVDQRDLNNAAAVSDAAETEQLVGGDTADFTVKDWASLLRQGAGEDYFAGRTATVTGFVTPDPDDPENVFYVARFVVTCCAVDAQPVGVPVYLPGWQSSHPVDSWVSASGAFGANPSTSSGQAIALTPSDVESIDQPAEPYVY